MLELFSVGKRRNKVEELPENCKPVLIKKIARYKYYKPQSLQYKAGIKGRWQEWNGYGWDNIEKPESWEYADE